MDMHDADNTQTSLVRVDQVHCRRGGREVLTGIDFDVRAGEVFTLLGPNGAGKSTTVGLILGLIHPSRGRISVLDHAPGSLAARQATGAMLQSGAVPAGLRVSELLALARAGYPDPVPERELADLTGLEGLRERGWDRLSGGQKRRVLLAMALAGNPRILFLDEPTAGLDVPAKRELWDTIRALREAGRAVLLATHDMREADALTDRVLLLREGRAVAVDSADGLRERIADRRVRCRTALTPTTIMEWAEAGHVREAGERLEILTARAEGLVARLLKNDPDLTELEVRAASLEEAFV